MRGQEHLIALRRSGKTPAAVWVFDGQPARASRLDRRLCEPDVISVCAEDNPRSLDMRFVVGLTVHVMAFDGRRFDGLLHACTEAGAKRVLGSLHDSTTYAVRRMTDTFGEFVKEPN